MALWKTRLIVHYMRIKRAPNICKCICLVHKIDSVTISKIVQHDENIVGIIIKRVTSDTLNEKDKYWITYKWIKNSYAQCVLD
jgi:hypothetical protein